MTDSQFWKLIEAARKKAPKDSGAYCELIQKSLEGMPTREIVAFDAQLRSHLRRACTFDLLAAAFIILSYVSDDVFEDFRAWLVAQGRAHFEKAIKAPNSIAEFLNPDKAQQASGSELLVVATRAYENKTGRDDFFEKMKIIPDPEIQQNWPESRAKFRERYPVLYDTFWNQKRIKELHKKR